MADDKKPAIRCIACGCAFQPAAQCERDGEIEYTFFRCVWCGKAYMVSVTDEKLRQSIEAYQRLVEQNRIRRLPEDEQIRMQQLKAENAAKCRELRGLYLKEAGHDGE